MQRTIKPASFHPLRCRDAMPDQRSCNSSDSCLTTVPQFNSGCSHCAGRQACPLAMCSNETSSLACCASVEVQVSALPHRVNLAVLHVRVHLRLLLMQLPDPLLMLRAQRLRVPTQAKRRTPGYSLKVWMLAIELAIHANVSCTVPRHDHAARRSVMGCYGCFKEGPRTRGAA